jgi:DNA-directed RNA polymerase subunit E'/Rpb7
MNSAEKNDVLEIFVSKLSEDNIVGRIGPVEVMIPSTRMPRDRCAYSNDKNVYYIKDYDVGEELVVCYDSRLLCRCYEVKIEMSTFLPTQTPP